MLCLSSEKFEVVVCLSFVMLHDKELNSIASTDSPGMEQITQQN